MASANPIAATDQSPHRAWHVRFGLLANISAAKSDVRFTPDSGRESGFPQPVMSALPLNVLQNSLPHCDSAIIESD